MEPLKLSPFTLDAAYADEWNVGRTRDFVVLTRGDKRINSSIYRIGGIGKEPDGSSYFMLLKYMESYYSEDILQMSGTTDPKHLEGFWCILDKNGIEKKVFSRSFMWPYLIDNSCLYKLNDYCYNIETDECYGSCRSMLTSKELVFLDTPIAIVVVQKQSGIIVDKFPK
jgi:hypothetical protein